MSGRLDDRTIDKVLYAGVSVTIDGAEGERRFQNAASAAKRPAERWTQGLKLTARPRQRHPRCDGGGYSPVAAWDGGQGKSDAPEYRGKHRVKCEADASVSIQDLDYAGVVAAVQSTIAA